MDTGTPRERRLHIGGQEAHPGWEILDVNPGPLVHHVGDAVDLSRFADGTFTEVYASHVLEHFDYHEALPQALLEWKRVLVPGGRLLLSVPDLDALAGLLLQRQRLSTHQRFQVMRMIFGGHIDPHDYHLVGLNQDFLAVYLGQAGYGEVRRVPGHGLFRDTSTMIFAGTAISLNLVACKPVTAAASPCTTTPAAAPVAA